MDNNFNQKVSETLENNIINLCRKLQKDMEQGNIQEYRTDINSVEKLLQTYYEQTFSCRKKDEWYPRMGYDNNKFYQSIDSFIKEQYEKINEIFNKTLENSIENDIRNCVAIINNLLLITRKISRYVDDICFAIDRYVKENKIQIHISGKYFLSQSSENEYRADITVNGVHIDNYEQYCNLQWRLKLTEDNHLCYRLKDKNEVGLCKLQINPIDDTIEKEEVTLCVEDMNTGAECEILIKVRK